MDNSIFVVSADGKIESVSPNSIYMFDIKWTPLMPFIQSHFNMPYSQRLLFDIPAEEESIEMGLYCIEENKKINAPFVWNHIKIETIEVVKGQSENEDTKFKADVLIYGQKYSCQNNYKHTFIVRNDVYFFMDSILGSINYLLDKGYSIEDIDFDFLDKQCSLALQSHQKIELCKEFHNHNFYELISTMKVEVYENGCGNRNGDFRWLEVKLSLNTTDKYIVHVITTVLKEKVWNKYRPDRLRTILDTNSTIFSFHTCNERDDSSCCGTYTPYLANDKTHKEIREQYTLELLIEGAKMLNKDDAFEYLLTKHKENN